MIDWLIDRLIEWLIDRLIDWLIDWLIACRWTRLGLFRGSTTACRWTVPTRPFSDCIMSTPPWWISRKLICLPSVCASIKYQSAVGMTLTARSLFPTLRPWRLAQIFFAHYSFLSLCDSKEKKFRFSSRFQASQLESDEFLVFHVAATGQKREGLCQSVLRVITSFQVSLLPPQIFYEQFWMTNKVKIFDSTGLFFCRFWWCIWKFQSFRANWNFMNTLWLLRTSFRYVFWLCAV